MATADIPSISPVFNVLLRQVELVEDVLLRESDLLERSQLTVTNWDKELWIDEYLEALAVNGTEDDEKLERSKALQFLNLAEPGDEVVNYDNRQGQSGFLLMREGFVRAVLPFGGYVTPFEEGVKQAD
jgi:hypothetical protein